MCTITNDPSITLPTEEKITAYKVFGYGGQKETTIPRDYSGDHNFKFGQNVWDKKMADCHHNEQSGFQVFVEELDAQIFACKTRDFEDLVCPVTILTEDIIKASNVFQNKREHLSKVFEVIKFKILKRDWNREKKQYE